VLHQNDEGRNSPCKTRKKFNETSNYPLIRCRTVYSGASTKSQCISSCHERNTLALTDHFCKLTTKPREEKLSSALIMTV